MCGCFSCVMPMEEWRIGGGGAIVQFPSGRVLLFVQEGKNVRDGGLEPPLLTEPDPKSGAATNYANRAFQGLSLCGEGSPLLCWVCRRVLAALCGVTE